VLRNAEKLEASLAALDLPPETLQKLKHDLRLQVLKTGKLKGNP
jgi:hypothetical protein